MVFNRTNSIKKLRQCLRDHVISIGSWMQIPNASIAEILGQSGYDWVAVDLEHGSFSLQQLPDVFRALELGHTLPLARLSLGDLTECKRILDAGAAGIIVPMIETAAQLKAIKKACCWPPAGERGVGFSRANLFGKHFDAYIEEAQAPLLVAMIEHVRAIENLPEILAVDGLDAILVGPYDLSASMALTAQFDHPTVIAAIQQIHNLSKQYDVACGIHVVQPSIEQLNQRITEGYRFIAYSVDAVFLNTYGQNPIKKEND